MLYRCYEKIHKKLTGGLERIKMGTERSEVATILALYAINTLLHIYDFSLNAR